MMRQVTKLLTVALVLAGATTAAYKFLLTDEAKEALRASARQVRSTMDTLSETLDGGQDVSAESLPNRRRVAQEWESLGF